MTESTPPPDQRWSDPAASQPAASQPAAPPPSYATTTGTTAVTTTERPALVTWGSITLIVLGALTILIGLLFLLGGAIFAGASGSDLESAGAPAGVGGMLGAFAGALIVIAIIVIAWGAVEIWAAVKAMAGRNWARITGMVLAGIAALFGLLGLFGTGQEGSNPVLSIVLLVANAFVVYAYATTGRWFASRSV